jgi:anti-sigma B factor antagonist
MNIEKQQRQGVTIVRPAGRMTGGDECPLRKAVEPCIEQRGACVVIDLSAVDFIGSAGLGELVRVNAQANTQGARVMLAAPSPFVTGVLETTQLNRFFNVAPSVDAAVEKLASST